MHTIVLASSEAIDHAHACGAVARVLNEALDGAEVPQSLFADACRSADRDPVEILSLLVQSSVLVVVRGKIFLGPVGRAFVAVAYVLA